MQSSETQNKEEEKKTMERGEDKLYSNEGTPSRPARQHGKCSTQQDVFVSCIPTHAIYYN